MKEQWKVFIRGIEGRGEEVIATLTNLGAKNDGVGGDNPNCIYFIGHDDYINCIRIGAEFAKIIEDTYKEIKLLEKWKDGDILINNDETCYKVFSNYGPPDTNMFCAYNVLVSVNGTITGDNKGMLMCDLKNYHLATPSEVERFYELLHTSNKDWNAENKKIVDLRWKPQNGEDYWTVIVGITIYKTKLTWIGSGADKIRYELGNCFRTYDEADAILIKIKLLFYKE